MLRKIFTRFRFPFLNNFQNAIHILEKLPQYEVFLNTATEGQLYTSLTGYNMRQTELQQQQLN